MRKITTALRGGEFGKTQSLSIPLFARRKVLDVLLLEVDSENAFGRGAFVDGSWVARCKK